MEGFYNLILGITPEERYETLKRTWDYYDNDKRWMIEVTKIEQEVLGSINMDLEAYGHEKCNLNYLDILERGK